MAKKRLTSSREPGKGVLNSYYLPKGLLKLRVHRDTTSTTPVCSRQIMVDPDHRFFLHFRGNMFFREAMDLAFTKEGFLQRIRSKSTKGEEAENATEWEAADQGAESGNSTPPDPPAGQVIYDYAFDPFDEKRLEEINKDLLGVKAGFKISIREMGSAGPEKGTSGESVSGSRSGVFYRPVEMVEVLFQGKGWVRRELMTFPHPDKVYFLDIPESAFSKPAFAMHFGFSEDEAYKGVPRQMSLDRPGEALTLAKKPVEVLRELIKIPGEIFQMKINTANNNASLYRAETDMQQALLDREVANQEYQEELDRQRIDSEEEQRKLQQKLEAERKAAEVDVDDLQRQLKKLRAEVGSLRKDRDQTPGRLSESLMEYDMRLQVVRYSSGPDSTLGALFDVTNGRKFLAYTMEDEFRKEKKHGETRIPAGVYPIRFRKEGGFHSKYSGYQWSKKIHKGMLHVQEVPGFNFILIHTGNDDEDTEGCLLVGDSSFENINDQGKIGSSRPAYKRIYPPIAAVLDAGKTVGIQYSDFDAV